MDQHAAIVSRDRHGGHHGRNEQDVDPPPQGFIGHSFGREWEFLLKE